MRGSAGGAHVGRLEPVEPLGGLRIGTPPVGDNAAAGLDVCEQESLQAVGADVLDDAQANAPKTFGAVDFHSRSEQDLAQRTASSDARFGSTEERLVDLHIAGEPVPTGAHHDRPVAVQHRPSGLVRAQRISR